VYADENCSLPILAAFEQIPSHIHAFYPGGAAPIQFSDQLIACIKKEKLSGFNHQKEYPNPEEEFHEIKGKPYLKKGTIKTYHPEQSVEPPPNLAHWQTPIQLQQAFQAQGLAELWLALQPYCHNGIQLIPTQLTADDNFSIGESKFGGCPDLPESIDWKKLSWRHEGSKRYLHFVAQFNLADLKPHDIDQRLPETGMLYIFADVDDEVAHELQDATNSKMYRIIHWNGELDSLQRAKLPSRNLQQLYACKLRMDHSLMPPIYSPFDGSELFRQLGLELSETQVEAYLKLLVAPGPYRLLGNPCGFEEAMFIDGKDQQLFLQMESFTEMALFFGDEGRWFVYGEPDVITQQNYKQLCSSVEFA